jgi:hypothetical protein
MEDIGEKVISLCANCMNLAVSQPKLLLSTQEFADGDEGYTLHCCVRSTLLEVYL